VRAGCTGTHIRDCRIYDIGDRAVQDAGTETVVEGVTTTSGFDRSVAFDVLQPDGEWYFATDPLVKNCRFSDHVEGSCIGVDEVRSEPTNGSPSGIVVTDNVLEGAYRAVYKQRLGVDTVVDVAITDNRITHTGGETGRPAFKLGGESKLRIQGDYVREEAPDGSQ
jgi:hypothetical protein